MGIKSTYPHRISTYDCTIHSKFSPVVALNWFQEAAQRQVEDNHIGFDFLDQNGLAWVVTRYDLTFHAYPDYGEEVTVVTESAGVKSFSAFRTFKLMREDGTVLIEGLSEWMLIDRKNGRVTRPDSYEEMLVLGTDAKTRFTWRRLSPVDTEKAVDHAFEIRFQDIDHNEHVNNATYLIWAIESIPRDVLVESNLKSLKIVFKNQAFLEDKGRIHTMRQETAKNTYRIDVMRDDEVLVQLLLEFE